MSLTEHATRAIKAKSERLYETYLENPNLCKYCSRPILKRQPDERLSQVISKIYCDSKCFGKHTNEKRKKTVYCNVCGIKIVNGRKRCDGCLNCYVSKIGDAVKCDSTHPKIRSHSRKFFKSKHPKVACLNCGYDKFTEVCHVKPVSEFPDGTLIVEINDIDNLIQLCRNCHWEFDKGLLNINTILKSVV